jgi:hypothetical protein
MLICQGNLWRGKAYSHRIPLAGGTEVREREAAPGAGSLLAVDWKFACSGDEKRRRGDGKVGLAKWDPGPRSRHLFHCPSPCGLAGLRIDWIRRKAPIAKPSKLWVGRPNPGEDTVTTKELPEDDVPPEYGGEPVIVCASARASAATALSSNVRQVTRSWRCV